MLMHCDHFLVSQPSHEAAARFQYSKKIGKYIVWHSNPSNTEITDSSGRHVGFVLGHAVSAGDNKEDNLLELNVNNFGDIASVIHAFQTQYVGSYLGFVLFANRLWMFGDPCASYPFVFDHETGRAASAASVLFDQTTYQNRIDDSLMAATNLARDDWLPSGLTAHGGVERILPNHALDVEAGKIIRTWPRRSDLNCTATLSFDRMVKLLQRVCAGFSQIGEKCFLPLTAGYDSRVVLALASRSASTPIAYTIKTPTGFDEYIAAKLALQLGIQHEIIFPRVADRLSQVQWAKSCGNVVGGANMRLFPTISFAGPSDVSLSGAGGEIGRSYYWSPADKESTPLSPNTLLQRMKLRPLPALIDKTKAWMSGLPTEYAFALPDIAYVEQRMGAWGGPQRYGNPYRPISLSPFNTRYYIDYAAFGMHPGRAYNSLPLEIICACRPELSGLPFNRFGNARDLLVFFQKLRRQPMAALVHKAIGHVQKTTVRLRNA